ncbi:hypothetical protein ANN_06795 [Periplaneta americana]|uniref:Uncharacterized protein n=1 Tax=Periplaneta americana TaxID=6978 RepID=A0ABQ8TFT1_PERAM|nr:hypothetical protein ANN_06795 [Periplaneta americana]
MPSKCKTKFKDEYSAEFPVMKRGCNENEAACKFCRHHHSYNSTTCIWKLFSEMFNDSKIAKTFSSAKFKTEAIVNNVISPLIQAEPKENLSESDFVGFSTDASNHKYRIS